MRAQLRRFGVYMAYVGVLALATGLILYSINRRLDVKVEVPLALGLALIGLFVLSRPGEVRRALTGRTARYGSNAAVMIAAFLGILILVNFLASRHHRRLDLTELKEHTLSPQTIQILAELKEPIKITGFFAAGDPRQGEVEDLLREYAYHSDKITYEFVDPDLKPGLARQYKITSYGILVFELGERRQDTFGTDEASITSAILKVSREEPKVVYFLTGHGERDLDSYAQDGYGQIKRALERDNFRVEPLNLAISGTVPADASVLVIAAPKTPLLEEERKAILGYLMKAGKALIMQDPGNEAGLNQVLEAWNVYFGDGLVIDPFNSLLGDAASPVAARYRYSPITKDLPMTFFPMARSVEQEETSIPGAPTITPLIQTSEGSWGERNLESKRVKYDEGEDQKGPLTIGLTVECMAALGSEEMKEAESTKTRLVVFGDSDFAANAFVGSLGNADLFLNAVNWLAEEELLSIRPKPFQRRLVYLTPPQMRLVLYSSVGLLPLLVLVVGAFVWWRRR